MNTPTPQPKIDEKAQIAIVGPAIPALILRYKTVKKAERDYKLIKDAMKKYPKCSPIIELKSDMFEAVVDIRTVANAAFVDIDKRVKFIAFT